MHEFSQSIKHATSIKNNEILLKCKIFKTRLECSFSYFFYPKGMSFMVIHLGLRIGVWHRVEWLNSNNR